MPPSSTRSYHPNKFQLITSRTQLYGFSFFPWTVSMWNTLPGIVLTAPSVMAFREGVAANLSALEGVFACNTVQSPQSCIATNRFDMYSTLFFRPFLLAWKHLYFYCCLHHRSTTLTITSKLKDPAKSTNVEVKYIKCKTT